MATTNIPFIMLDEKRTSCPIYKQIYDTIRRSILSGEFESNMQLPATRLLAEQLGVSRMTVINAYEQLFAEGYLEGKIGAGTFVASHLPEEFLQTPRIEIEKKEVKTHQRKLNLSKKGISLLKKSGTILQCHRATSFTAFQHGITAVDKFPFEVWAKIAQKFYRKPPREMLGYGDSAGFRPLREAVAAHLESTRGVRCSPDQVVIINGTQQGVDLIGRVLLDPQDKVWMEEPCYLGARDTFASMGARIVHVEVDDEGFDLKQAQRQCKTARLVYVTPSHQFPLGVTMSLARRLSLLKWASGNEAWIIEDDYNSEYRYTGRPLASLQGLDCDGRVIYLGTFSKTIFPSLRLGCLVVPPDLIDVFTAARALSDLHSPVINQAILAEFIAEGHLARHVRRMRGFYEERQEILITEVKKKLGGLLDISKMEAGMHLIGWLPKDVDDKTVSQKAAEVNLQITPVSAYRNRESMHNGLMFGYTGFDEKQIKEGVKKLARVLTNMV